MTKPRLSPYRPPPVKRGPEPIVARVVDDEPAELRLALPDCPSRDEFVQQAFPPEPQPVDQPPAPPSRFRFSVLDLMVVTAGISVGLAGGTWMPPQVFALCMGLLTVGGLIVVEMYPPESRSGWLAWIAVVLAYLAAWLAALAGP